jgi:hypothetical protein
MTCIILVLNIKLLFTIIPVVTSSLGQSYSSEAKIHGTILAPNNQTLLDDNLRCVFARRYWLRVSSLVRVGPSLTVDVWWLRGSCLALSVGARV